MIHNDHKSHIEALNKVLGDYGLPNFDSEYLGRDSLVEYCLNNKVSLHTESIPVDWLHYEPFDLGMDVFDGDADEWGHNLRLATIFVEYLSKESDRIHIISETFSNEPMDRAISIPIAEWSEFVFSEEMQFNLIGDILIFDSKYNQAMIFFHHDQVHVLSLKGDAKSLMDDLRKFSKN